MRREELLGPGVLVAIGTALSVCAYWLADRFFGLPVVRRRALELVREVVPSDTGDGRFDVELGVRDVIVIHPSGLVSICDSPYHPTPGNTGRTHGGFRTAEAEELMSHIAGNVRCGMREFAYFQASKAKPDCRVKLERLGQ